MGKLRQLSSELWPLIDIILFSYSELIFRGGVSCLPAALLLNLQITRKCISWMHSNCGQIGKQTTELAVLEHLS